MLMNLSRVGAHDLFLNDFSSETRPSNFASHQDPVNFNPKERSGAGGRGGDQVIFEDYGTSALICAFIGRLATTRGTRIPRASSFNTAASPERISETSTLSPTAPCHVSVTDHSKTFISEPREGPFPGLNHVLKFLNMERPLLSQCACNALPDRRALYTLTFCMDVRSQAVKRRVSDRRSDNFGSTW